jgi:hypothetical protein
MANVVPIEDKDGQLVDLLYYCSDFCAKTNPAYAGWYGCVDNYSTPFCQNCKQPLFWINEETQTTFLGNEEQNV